MQHGCVCGNELVLTLKAIYGSDNKVYCNDCENEIIVDIIYHCMNFNSVMHPNGYDLCEQCYIKNYIIKQQNNQYENYCAGKTSNIIEMKLEKQNNCESKSNDAYQISDHIDYSNVSHELIDCVALKQIKNLFYNIRYHGQSKHSYQLDIVKTLDNYLHLLQYTENNENFEYIYNYLCNANCSINGCEAFQNNYRNRSNDIYTVRHKANVNTLDIARSEIVHKIHCFFYHSFDIGNRLSLKERLEMIDDMKVDDSTYFVNKQLIKMQNILQNKRQKINNVKSIDNKLNIKYNQLHKKH
eukprot:210020_1